MPASTAVDLTVRYLRSRNSIECKVSFDEKGNCSIDGVEIGSKSWVNVLRYLARKFPQCDLYGKDAIGNTEVDHWLHFGEVSLCCSTQRSRALKYLNNELAPVTFLVGNQLTIADVALWSILYDLSIAGDSETVHMRRWFNFIRDLIGEFAEKPSGKAPSPRVLADSPPVAGTDAPAKMSKQSSEKGKPSEKAKPLEKSGVAGGKQKDQGKFVDLPGAKMGEVVVRFPPEASGYLHVGHAKAALLNQYYQKLFNGKLILRFDDTNPAKETSHFEQVILKDLELLDIKPDVTTHTSDHFDSLIKYCEQLIKSGDAYVDDTDGETMKKEREERVNSKNRDNPVERNLKMWREMLEGTDFGQTCCVRAKIDMKSDNGAMRDPALYRCKVESHVSTGDKYKAYPTYDFACPIVDSVEGVTHALRTTEYLDRDDQYLWILDRLKMRKPHIWSYARLNLQNTVLSKRKLAWLVEQGVVDSWEDPRFPTVRGIVRRGLTVQGLADFIVAQGGSRSVVQMEWDKIWAFNKKVIDPVAPRYTALAQEKLVPVKLKGGVVTEIKPQPAHPKNADVGMKEVAYQDEILFEQADALELKEGEPVTLINWGNCVINKVIKKGEEVVSVEATLTLEDTDYKKTKLKLTWLPRSHPQADSVSIVARNYSHIVSKPVLGNDEDFKQFINYDSCKEQLMVGDHNMKKLKKGDIIQIQRKGFYICDRPYVPFNACSTTELPCILIYIPDGSKSQEEQERQAAAKTAKQTSKAKDKSTPAAAPSGGKQSQGNVADVSALVAKITASGDKVRQLKAEKASKDVVKAAVDELLELKNQFKSQTGLVYSPENAASLAASSSPSAQASATPEVQGLVDEIAAAGDKVRALKAANADKAAVKTEVDALLALKKQFKDATGLDHNPQNVEKVRLAASGGKAEAPKSVTPAAGSPQIAELVASIAACGDKVRQLKAEKKDKAVIKEEVDKLLALKTQFKAATGLDHSPDNAKKVLTESGKTLDGTMGDSSASDDLYSRIAAQGETVRQLKNSKAPKTEVDPAVQKLLALKKEYKEKTGKDYQPETGQARANKENSQGDAKKKQGKQAKEAAPVAADDAAGRKQTKLGLDIKIEDNFADWYVQVITKAELIEYYDVSGCYILRPMAYSVWEKIQAFFDGEIKKLGVENVYFPMFVSRAALEREQTHIADFAPEVAWVTKSGQSDLAEPIAIRPTSETVMYPSYAKWIQSHRDLPLKLNQWNNVVRWEFKNPTPFLRTREFLWQEGHTAFTYRQEACDEVMTILELYARVYQELLAIPVVKGRKTEKEKFAGGDFTTTCEAFIPHNGRGVQGATSHHLGQNFSKMFNITIEDPDKPGEHLFVYQNSWGLSTRSIGAMVMVHGDNKGLVLPPRIALYQTVVVPCGVSGETEGKLAASCEQLYEELRASDVSSKLDLRPNYSPGWKFNHWEQKGIPIRVELGPKDMEKNQVTLVRRDTGAKSTAPRAEAVTAIKKLLDDIQTNLFSKAKHELDTHLKKAMDFDQFCKFLDGKNIILAPFCGEEDCEDNIKRDSARGQDTDAGAPSMGAKSLCIPFDQPKDDLSKAKCVYPGCKAAPKNFTLFGRSY